MNAGPDSTIVVRVRLFAMLREQAGSGELELELPAHATVADALRSLRAREGLGELLARMPVQMAVNREYASPETELGAHDEIALIPPLSGGAGEASSGVPGAVHVEIREEPLQIEPVCRAVAHRGAGALVVFEGVTREVEELQYEAYTEMARERIERILTECSREHRLLAAAAEHRVGRVPLGEPSVIVAVSAAHRAEAFAGGRQAIDRIKSEAPIWKRERTGADVRWVEGTPPPGSRAADAPRLTHIDERGRARMVDVAAKQPRERVARARARVRMSPQSAGAVAAGQGPKGEVLAVARLAGVQAAKRTASLIPLAHPLELTLADVDASVDVDAGVVELTSEVRTVARTGVEMEAMTACAVAALTVYDMVKGIERGIEIEQVVLLEKHGGRSDYVRSAGEQRGAGATGAAAQTGSSAGEAPERRPHPFNAAVITISTSKAAGHGEDESGARLVRLVRRLGGEVIASEVIPDERERIEQRLAHFCAQDGCALVLTSGGTGLSPSDVTPEATGAVIERHAPGIAEAMRAASREHTPNWMLSRALAGVREGTLIVNFPGSPTSIDQTGERLAGALQHALALIAGGDGGHAAPQ